MKFSSNASLIFVAALLLAACSAKSSDEVQVRELFASAEAAAEARDTADVLELVADDYSDAQSFDKPSLQNFLRLYFLAHPKIELIVSIEKLEFPVPGLAQTEISVATVGGGDANLQRLKVELRKSGDDWRVSRADRL
jgi:ketosteroid isomerase-like protein